MRRACALLLGRLRIAGETATQSRSALRDASAWVCPGGTRHLFSGLHPPTRRLLPAEADEQLRRARATGWSGEGRGERARCMSTAASEEEAPLSMTPSAVERLMELTRGATDDLTLLRLSVESGGCSGFQYNFELESEANISDEDIVVTIQGVKMVTDIVSLELVRGATIDFEDSLIRSAFVVASNPHAESACGCGASFVAK
ncbi:unnamed protein product [Pedinophyceae sp. YPF-701]|nr:unnamed protein product [Pedinophyceae sp. YPF-701]